MSKQIPPQRPLFYSTRRLLSERVFFAVCRSLLRAPVIFYTRGRAYARVGSNSGRWRLVAVLLLTVVLMGGLGVNLITPLRTAAATSDNINFQARLENSNGAIADDGTYNVQFKLYSVSTGGSPLWTETYLNSASQGVRVVNGYLTVNLGSITAFPSTIPWDQDLYVTMNIGGTTTGAPSYDGEMSPRLKLTSVPYAFQAKSASQLQVSNGGNVATLSFATPTATNNILLPNASGTVCLNSSAACGFAFASGSNSYIQNGTSLQGNANFNIQTTATGSITATIQALTGQTADLLRFENSVGSGALSGFNSSGQLYYQSGSFTGTLVQDSLAQSTIYHLPDPGSGSATICLTTGNCAGTGGGITGTGTINYVARFNSAGSINASSLLYDNGSFIGVNTTSNNGQLSVVSSNASQAGVFIQAAPSATTPALVLKGGATPGSGGNLIDFQDTSGALLATITADGSLLTGSTAVVGSTTTPGGTVGRLTVVAGGGANVGSVVRAGAAQTANLLELQDNAGLTNAAFNATGNQLTLGRIAGSGTVTQGKLRLSDGTTDNFALTLQSGTLTANSLVTIPNAGGSDTVCLLSLANCTGTGGGIAGAGTQNYISKFDTLGGNHLGNSSLYDDGSFLGLNTTTDSGLFSIQGATAAQPGLFVQAAASATTPVVILKGGATPGTGGNLLELQTSAGTPVASFDAVGNFVTSGSATVATGLTVTGGATITGGTSINTSGTANTNIGNSGGTLSLTSTGLNLTTAGAISGVTTLTASGAITAANSGNTINGLIINGGAISGATGYTQGSGNFSISGSGSFSTGTGAIGLNGDTTITGTHTLTTGSGAITFGSLGAGLVQSSSGGLLSSGAVDRNSATYFSNALTIANGGTGANSLTANGLLYGNGTGTIQATSAAANSILATNGSSVPGLTQVLPTAVQGNITATGALASGSIASGFGAISTTNNISTTAQAQAGTLTVGSAAQLQVDASGNLTTAGAITVNGSGTGLTVANSASIGSGLTIVSGGAAISGASSISYTDNTGDGLSLIVANNATNSGTHTVNGSTISLSGAANSLGGNINNALRFAAVTPQTGNTFTGLSFGTGYNSLLSYNGTAIINGTGLLQNAGLDAATTYSNLQKVGALSAGSIASGFGTISTGNTIATTATVQGGIVQATTGFALSGATTAGHYLRNDGANFVDSALLAGDISGTLVNLHAGSGTDQAVATGQTVNFLAGGSNNLTTTTSAGTRTVTVDIVSNPSFSGLITGSANTTGLALTGSPLATGETTSLLQLGNAISGGNTGTNGGTYFGINQPSTGAGSAADFLNFQSNGTVRLQVSSTGDTTVGGNLNVGGPQFTNSGATLNTATSLGNFATGGSIGSAASTVDTHTTISIGQTTALQTLTLPTPSSTAAGRIVYILNTGSVDFTMHGVSILAGKSQLYIWNGSAWVSGSIDAGTNSVSAIGTIDGQSKSADGAVISVNTLYLQSADASFPGLVTIGAQTFGGNKTFNGDVILAGSGTGLSVTNDATVGGTATAGTLNVTNGATIGTGLTITSGGETITGGGLTITAGDLALTAGNLTTAGVQRLSNSGALSNITGFAQTGGSFSLVSSGLNVTAAGAVSGVTTLSASSTLTLSGTGANQLAITGAPASSATNSLMQIGSAIAGGNNATNGGTYLGLNAPTSGAGSAADFLNFQVGGTSKFKLDNTGALALSGAITAPSSGNTINGVVINSGALSGITGFSQSSGNFAITGGGTFSTSTGAISLNGNTAITGSNTLTVGSGAVTLGSLGAGLVQSSSGGLLSSGAVDRNSSTFFNTTLTVANGGTGVGTLAANGILYGNGTGAVQATAAAADSILVTNGSNLPGLTQTLPTAVQGNITGTGALSSGSIASGFGAISTGNTITTTATLQGANVNATAGFQISGAATAGHYLRGNAGGTAYVDSALLAGDISGTLFSIVGSTGSSQPVTAGGTVSILKGASNNLTTASSATDTITVDIVQNPTFTNTVTASNSSGVALAVSGTPTVSATQSLLQIGNAIAGGNNTAGTGGTYIGINEPASGAGSTADFLDFQNNSVVALKVTSTGALTLGGAITGPTAGNTINGVVINSGALSGITGITTNGAYTQTGTGANAFSGASTFSASGTGLSVTNNATIGGTLQTTGLGTFNGGLTVATGSTFTNASSTLLTALAISDKPTGGSLGSAATTVDVATTFNVSQTTAGQNLTLPLPTVTTGGRIIYINNVGSASFTIGSVTLAPGSSDSYMWNGSSWIALTTGSSTAGVTTVGTIDSQIKSTDGAVISGSTIYLQNADATSVGLVSAGTQTFGGAKTFAGAVTVQGQGSFTAAGTGLSITNNATIGGTATAGILSVTNAATIGTGLTVTAGGATITAGDLALTGGNLTTGGTQRLSNAGALSSITGYAQSSGNFLQSGSGTFGTGSGAVSLNGATAVTGSNTFTVGIGATALGGTLGVAGASTFTGLGTFNGGLTVGSSSPFINTGSTTFSSVAIADHASNSTIGSAASTVNVATTFDVTQTTAGITLTLPSPTVTTSGRVVYINSLSGNADFTMYGVTITAGTSAAFIWNGSAWVATSTGGTGVNTIGTVDSQTKSANGAVINGSTLVLQTADATNIGLISTGVQTLAGAKTFSGAVTVQGAGSFTAAGTGLSVTNNATIGGTATVGSGLTITSGGATITAGGLTVTAGASSFGGSVSVTGSNALTVGTGTVTFGSLGAGLVQSNSSGVLSSGAVDRNSATLLSNALNASNGGTGLTTTTAYGLITGGTTATGNFQNAGTGSAGQILQSNGNAALPTWVTATAANTCSDCLIQNPLTTGRNTIAPTTNSVVALTVKGTTGTATDVLDIYNSAASPTLQAAFDANGALNVAQAIRPTANNAVDLGLSGTAFRTGYFGTSLITPAVDTAATLSLGTGSATAITIGKSGVTTTNAGALTVSGLLTGNAGATISGPVAGSANALTVTTGATSNVGLLLKSVASQTEDFLQIRNSTNTLIGKIDSSANIAVNNFVDLAGTGPFLNFGGAATILETRAAGNAGLIIKGAGSQIGDLFQLQNSSGVILTAFQADGKLVFGPSGSQDTNLYRSNPNELKTDDSLVVGAALNVSGNTDLDGTLTVGTGNAFTINASGAITAATGITSSGSVQFSGLNSVGLVRTDASGNLATGAVDRNSSTLLSNNLNVSNGGTGLSSTTAYGILTGGTTSTGNLQQIGTGTAGQVLVSGGSSALPSFQSATAANTCTDCLRQAPTTTAQNTIAPTTNSVVALTVKGTTGTAAHVMDIYDSTATPALQGYFDAAGALNVSQAIRPTANNTVDLGLSGTAFRTGYFGTSVLAPAFDVASAGTLNLGTGTATAISLGKSGVTTTNAGALTVSQLTTANGGLTVASAGTFRNDRSTVLTAIAIADHASNSTIGSAASTVDAATTFDITQTTAGITLSLPTPTTGTSGRIAYVNSLSGNADFTIHGVTMTAGTSAAFIYNGSAWVATGTGGSGVNVIGTIDTPTKSANGAHISGSALYLQTADATNVGMVSTGTQTFAGAKTFSGAVTVQGQGSFTAAGTGLSVTNNATIGGTLDVTGNFNINTNKFQVAASSGNTTVGGTLGVTGATTLTGTLAVGSSSQFTINATGAITAATGITSSGSVQFSGLNSVGIVQTNGSGTLSTSAVDRNSATLLSNALNVSNGGTGLTTTTAYGLITGGTTATGNFQNAGTGSAGQILQSNGNAALPTWVAATAASTCSDCLIQNPLTTGRNTITPTTNSVVGLTVNGTSGTAATAVNIVQGGAAANLTLSNTAATSSNLISLTQNTSAYTGTAVLLNIAAGSGSFSSGNFLDLQKNSVSKFLIDNSGLVQLAGGLSTDITTANSAGGTANAVAVAPGSSGVASGTGAALSLKAGTQSGNAGIGGSVTVQGGNATGTGTTFGGSVIVDGGTGSTGANNGTVYIGQGNASNVILGHTGINVNSNGNLIVAQNQSFLLQSTAGTGTFTDNYANTTGTAATFAATASGSSGSNTVNGVAINLAGTNNAGGSNTVNAINLGNVTGAPTNNTFNAFNIGTGYTNYINAANLVVTSAGNADFNGTLTVGTANAFTINASGAITAATGITSSGSIQFSGLNSVGLIRTDASGNLATGAVDRNSSSLLSNALNVSNGGTGATTLTANGILFGSGTSAIQATAAAADSILATNGSNVPGLTQTLPTAVQGNITSTGAVTAGSIGGSFGTISTGSNISTTALIQGGTLSAASGAFAVNGSGVTTYANGTSDTSTLVCRNAAGQLAACTSSFEATTGNDFIRNQTTVQTPANFYVRSAAAGSVVGIIEGANTQTADLLRLNTYNGTSSSTVAKVDKDGNLTAVGGTFNGSVSVSGTNTLAVGGTISGTNTTTGLALTGILSGSTTTSLLQMGTPISGGQGAGTYLGINAPAASTADFLDLQTNGTIKLTVTSAGLVNARGGFAVGANTGITASCSGGQVLTGADYNGGISTSGTCSSPSGFVTLQNAYDNSGATNPQITLNSSYGGLKIADGSTAVTGNLFQVTNNAGTTAYLGVTSTGVTTAGTLTVNGTGTSSIAGRLNLTTGSGLGLAVTSNATIGGTLGVGSSSQFQVDATGNVNTTGQVTVGPDASHQFKATSSGTLIETYGSNSNSTAATFAVTNLLAGAGSATVNGLGINLTGTSNSSGTNVTNGINFGNIAGTPMTGNTFNGLAFGTGYTSLVSYNGTPLVSGTGKLQDAALDSAVTYTNLQKVGALGVGSIGGSFGTISTTNNITTTAALQGNTLAVGNASTFDKFTVDASGNTLVNGGTLTVGTSTQFQVSALGVATLAGANGNLLAVTSAPTATANLSLVRLGGAIAGGNNTAGTGGTYLGINQPATGAGSTADFVNFQNNGTSEFKVASNGNTTINGTLNVQNAGSATPALSVSGIIATSSLGTTGTSLLCYNASSQISSCGTAVNSGSFIYNGTSLQTTANFNIQSANSSTNGTVGATIQGAAGGQTVDLLQPKNTAGTILTAFQADGKLVFGPSGSQDTNLYRSNPNELKTDDAFIVTGLLTATDDVAINGGDLTSSASTFNLLNGTVATANILGAATAITLGGTTASNSINIGNGTIANGNTGTINIGTSATGATGKTAITIGSVNAASSLTLQGGTGNINLFPSGSTSTGVLVKPGTNSSATFQIQNSTGTKMLTVDTGSNNVLAVNLGTTAAVATIDDGGSLRVRGSTSTDYTTPLSATLSGNSLVIENQAYVANSAALALGLTSTANSLARGIEVADARASAHQPSIGVFSPDESLIGGFSWDGSNVSLSVKTNDKTVGGGASGGINLKSGDSTTGNGTGSVTVDSGSAGGGGTPGSVNIGTTNTRSITVGNNTTTTVLNLTGGTGGIVATTTGGISLTAAASGTALLDAGAGGTVSLGASGVNKTIQLGNTLNAVTTTIGIGNSAFSGSVTNTTIGSATTSSTLVLQGVSTKTTYDATGLSNKTTTDTSTGFNVQNSVGAMLFTVDTTNSAAGNNLAKNSGAEAAGIPSTSNNWSAFGTSTVSQDTTAGEFVAGAASAKAAMTGAANSGVQNNLGAALTNGSQVYYVSFSVKSSTNIADLTVAYYRQTSTFDVLCTGYSSQTVNTADGFKKVNCTITTTATAGASTAFLAIYQAGGATRNLFVDNLSIVKQDTTGALNVSQLRVGGVASQGLTLLTADSYAGRPNTNATIGSALLGSMYYDTTLGKMQCYEASGWGYCGASPDVSVNIVPEYTGAVLNGTGIGTLTSDLCANQGAFTGGTAINSSLCSSGQMFNYYIWNTIQPTAQSYSIYVRYQLPATYKSIDSSAPVTLQARSTDVTGTDGVKLSMYDASGNQCGTTQTLGTAGAWTPLVISTASITSPCVLAANAVVMFKIDVTATNGGTAYVSNLSFLSKGQ